MRKRIIAILLCAVIVVAFGAYLLFPPSLSPSRPKIGIFYYLWYDTTSPESWNKKKIVDTPVLGDYDSCNSTVISQHLRWIQDLNIDFIIISWWGNYDDYGKYTDNATKQVFETAQNISSNLKFAIMEEPFNKTGNSYDYNGIYNHIYDNFVEPYSSLYYNDSKPVICFFNNQNLTDNGAIPLDERFNTVLVGQQSYTQWIYTDVNIYDLPAHGPLNQTSVTPRYDESRLSERRMHFINDSDLTQGLYDREWEKAIQLWKDGKIDTILISTWNEYPERTAIEPHYDNTSYNPDPYFLYNKTEYYISQIEPTESPTPSPTPEYSYTLATTAVIIIAVTISYVFIRLRKNNRKSEKF